MTVHHMNTIVQSLYCIDSLLTASVLIRIDPVPRSTSGLFNIRGSVFYGQSQTSISKILQSYGSDKMNIVTNGFEFHEKEYQADVGGQFVLQISCDPFKKLIATSSVQFSFTSSDVSAIAVGPNSKVIPTQESRPQQVSTLQEAKVNTLQEAQASTLQEAKVNTLQEAKPQQIGTVESKGIVTTGGEMETKDALVLPQLKVSGAIRMASMEAQIPIIITSSPNLFSTRKLSIASSDGRLSRRPSLLPESSDSPALVRNRSIDNTLIDEFHSMLPPSDALSHESDPMLMVCDPGIDLMIHSPIDYALNANFENLMDEMAKSPLLNNYGLRSPMLSHSSSMDSLHAASERRLSLDPSIFQSTDALRPKTSSFSMSEDPYLNVPMAEDLLASSPLLPISLHDISPSPTHSPILPPANSNIEHLLSADYSFGNFLHPNNAAPPKSPSSRITCPYDTCNLILGNAAELRAHIRDEHSQDLAQVCPFPDCGKSYLDQDRLQSHIRFRHISPPAEGVSKSFETLKTQNSTNLTNSDWPLKFENPTNFTEKPNSESFLNLPSTSIIDTPNNSTSRASLGEFICTASGCDKTFSSAKSLAVHFRTHSGDKPYVCSYPDCGKSFSQPSGLRSHIFTHTGDRPYTCSLCPKSYTTSSRLKVHFRTHTQEEPYVCDCGKRFKQKSNLTQHQVTHLDKADREVLGQINKREIECGVCGKFYKTLQSLDQHSWREHGRGV